MQDLSDVRPAFSAVVRAEPSAWEARRPCDPNRQICAQTTVHLTALTEIHTRHPRTIVTVWGQPTVCEATARPGLPWVGLPTAHGPTPAAQGAAAAGPGRQGRRHNLPAMYPGPRADDHATHAVEQTYLFYSHLSVLPTL
jgi:hypothetical protein